MHRFLFVVLAALATACARTDPGTPQGLPDAIPDTAKSGGAWSALYDWPIIPIHVALLPDGRVVNFGTDLKTLSNSDPNAPYPAAYVGASMTYDIWSPSLGFGDSAHLSLHNTTGDTPDDPYNRGVDFFCAAQILLPEPTTANSGPSVLVVGGDTIPRPDPNKAYAGGNPNSALIGDDNLLTRGADLNRGRWYATITTLLNGDIYVQGGTSTTYKSGIDHPELRSGNTFTLLTGITTGDPSCSTSASAGASCADPTGDGAGYYRFYYPRAFVVGDGRIFGFDTNGKMYRVDPYANGGTGSLTPAVAAAASSAGTVVLNPDTTPTDQFANEYRSDFSTAAMFAPGRILEVGGNANKAMVIDVRSGGAPLLTTTADYSAAGGTARKTGTATILPTGDVLLTGGSVTWNVLPGIKTAEIWSPVTGQWTAGPEEAVARLYHSTALLMPNGSVLVGGGGGPGPHADPNDANSPQVNNFNAEVYFPPYLFDANGAGSKLAARPEIKFLSADPVIGGRFVLAYPPASGAIARVTLVKSGAMTHNFNMDQRFIELSFRPIGAGRLEVLMPSNPADATPGYYLLSLIDGAGHPSISKLVFVNTAEPANPAVDPAITNPGDQASTVGTPITPFNVVAADPRHFGLTFAAGHLPPGLSMDYAGRISGTPTAAGSYDAVVAASNGQRTATANLVWRVN